MAILQIAFQAKAEPQVSAVVLDAAFICCAIHVVATKARMPSVYSRLSMGSAKNIAWLCLWRSSNLDSQSCFLGLGLAKALATIEKIIATTKRAEMRTKPPRRITRMTSRGPLKCLWAASVAKLVTASRLSLMRRSPSLHGQQRHGANLTKWLRLNTPRHNKQQL